MTALGFLAAALSAAFAMGVMEFAEARTGTDRAAFAIVAACSAIGLLAVIGIIVG